MIVGVLESELKIIDDILADYKAEYQFYAYGSRVKGNFGKISDLDVLVKGEQEMPFDVWEELKDRFDKSRLPYVVNFADYHKIDKGFYRAIKEDLTLN